MPIYVKCDRCMKDMNEPSALAFSPPSADGKVEKFHICRVCWESTRQWIMSHRHFVGRKPVEPCPESAFRAPNDLSEEMTYGPVMVNFGQQVTKRDKCDMTVIERLRNVFDAVLSLSSEMVFDADLRIDALDPNLDILDKVELVMAIEEEFGIPVADWEEDKWKTVGDIVMFIGKAEIKEGN